ncbi:MAG: DUF1844 domain-containing protein [Phycisphaerales bacterium]
MADAPNNPDMPKIIVDSDWKSQAQAEKERLASKESTSAPKKGPKLAGAPESPSAPPGSQEELPPADFRTLIGSLATQALLYLGGFPDPQTGRAMVALDLAQHYIELLAVLEEKTRNNLTPDESSELSEVAHDLRMRFVQITEALARAEARSLQKESEARLSNPGPTT